MKTVEQAKLEDAIYAIQVAIRHEGQGFQRDRWEALLPELQEHHRQMAVENARIAKQQQQNQRNNPAPIPLHTPAAADPANTNLGADTKTGQVIPLQTQRTEHDNPSTLSSDPTPKVVPHKPGDQPPAESHIG